MQKMNENNLIPRSAARNIIEQVQSGACPSTKTAAESVGYKHIPKSESLQKALFSETPIDWLSKIQKKQLKAAIYKKMKFSAEHSREQLVALLKKHQIVWIDMIQEKHFWHVLVALPDWDKIDKALDKYYKIAGAYAPEKHQLVRPLEEMSDTELWQLVNQGKTPELPQAQALKENSDKVSI